MSEEKIDDGGPAFPTHPAQPNGLSGEEYGLIHGKNGLSRRDWFAGMALSGFLSDIPSYADEKDMNAKQISFWAYEIADAMIAQGKKS